MKCLWTREEVFYAHRGRHPMRMHYRSGARKDGRLTAFDIVNCESGEKYCQVCRFGNSPKIMAVGTADDEEIHPVSLGPVAHIAAISCRA